MTKENSKAENEINYDFLSDDDSVYAPFDGNWDVQIVVPVEFVQDDSAEVAFEKGLLKDTSLPLFKRKLTKRDLLYIFERSVDFVEYTGSVTNRFLKKLFEIIAPFAVVPFSVLFSLLKKGFAKVKSIKLKPSSFKADIEKISFELSAVKNASKKVKDRPFVTFLKAVWKYFLISFSRHEHFWKTLFNVLFPAAAALVMVLIFTLSDSSIYALQVFYNGQSIGYVENKEDFDTAKNLAMNLLLSGSESENSASSAISVPSFKTARIKANQLSNPTMISENIIALSDEEYTMACGVFIDGEFFCAVRNESDAQSVFGSILAPYEKKAANGTSVGFVEEVQYVQGLYPTDSKLIWDSQKLKAEAIKKVRVKVMKTRQRTEKIPYETVKKNSSYLTKGTTKTSQKGVKGEYLITELLTYIDGKLSYTSTISKVQTKAPVNEIILVGTRQSYSYGWYSGGSYYSSSFIWPTRGANAISSYYGYRSASISGWSFHGGIDIVTGYGNSTGVPVVASASGTVVTAIRGYSGYGHTVVIDHGGGIRTRYAHMQPGSLTVYAGQKVYQGQQIGRIGSTGNSTGPHLHFEVLVNGVKKNPLSYIRR